MIWCPKKRIEKKLSKNAKVISAKVISVSQVMKDSSSDELRMVEKT